jgi:hypothetical protein
MMNAPEAYFKDEGDFWTIKLTPDCQLPLAPMYPFGFLKTLTFFRREDIIAFCTAKKWIAVIE